MADIVFDGMTFGGAFFITIFQVIAYMKFAKGEFRQTLFWITFCYVTYTIDRFFRVLSFFAPTYENFLIAIATFFLFLTLVGGLMFAYSIYQFSKKYGFLTKGE